MTKKLLIFSLFCGLSFVGIIYFEEGISRHLIGEDDFVRTIVVGVIWVLTLTAILIPFGIFIVRLSGFIEKTKEDSILYTDKKDEL